jgi:hypothetical protein
LFFRVKSHSLLKYDGRNRLHGSGGQGRDGNFEIKVEIHWKYLGAVFGNASHLGAPFAKVFSQLTVQFFQILVFVYAIHSSREQEMCWSIVISPPSCAFGKDAMCRMAIRDVDDWQRGLHFWYV